MRTAPGASDAGQKRMVAQAPVVVERSATLTPTVPCASARAASHTALSTSEVGEQ
ncbi:hypothetical protein [Corynebacterium auris]|uniref:hypothetical protein n=1 Tax=Corynebacterium auris TaxID=44750 RepID=UPI0025B366E4|nr:hypothetical protein [Corynebacterium auris]